MNRTLQKIVLDVLDKRKEISMLFILKDSPLGSDILGDLKDFNSKSLATQANKGKQIGFYDTWY